MNKIVVKIGTNCLVTRNEDLNLEFIRSLAKQIRSLAQQDKKIILVSSGAVYFGKKELGESTTQRQTLGAIGQHTLFKAFDTVFHNRKLRVGQYLVSKKDLETESILDNLMTEIDQLDFKQVIPIFNENDALHAGDEEFDNDLLAANIANAWNADLLILLSGVEGIYNEKGEVIKRITKKEQVAELDTEKKSVGKGGIMSKLRAAEICNSKNISVRVASGKQVHVVQKIIDGEDIGSLLTLEDEK